MPDFNNLSEAISTLKGLHDGSIDPNTIDLPNEDNEVEDNPTPPDDNPNPDDQPEVEEEDSSNPDDDGEEEQEEEIEQEEDKKVQTPEENRKFAEQRRQQELERRVQEELNRKLQESPEMQIAKMLADQFGVTPEQMLEQIQLGMLQEQNPEVAPEIVEQQFRQQQQTTQLEQQLSQLQQQLWERDVKLEASEFQKQYPVLTNEDVQSAMDYMKKVGSDVNFKQAAMAVHGDKLVEYQITQARNELLAEKSGRKSPLTPQGGKSPSTPTLTDEERQVAQLMGVSEEDYLKYK